MVQYILLSVEGVSSLNVSVRSAGAGTGGFIRVCATGPSVTCRRCCCGIGVNE
jgi:hypothetical protein